MARESRRKYTAGSIRAHARKHGAKPGLLEKILILVRICASKKVPPGVRVLAAGAIVYFLNPADLWPDPTPGGFTDDMVVVTLALLKIKGWIKD